ncbi:transposase [Ectothiorhodospira mobilis]|uniref:transposase n=1 Tax=Ectothiorhodospira mobilis TaxID=195064 RepID=UPI001EE8E6E0|nr:transposase [Ectothiorhodospira mobilis]MCG5536849.1 transposase [Ectothiorhodospira mobilis]
MPRYSDERKEAVLAKLLPPHSLTVKQVAEQENISEPTIYKWRQEAREQGQCFPDSDHPDPEGWTSRDKFAAVVETAAMNAQERSEYCRSRGLYTGQLERWRVDCEQAADLADSRRQSQERESKAQRKRIKALEKELQRKEAALAETAALLTLRKKAQAIWGEPEEDD